MMRMCFEANLLQIVHCDVISFLSANSLIIKRHCDIVECTFVIDQVERLKYESEKLVSVAGCDGFVELFDRDIIKDIASGICFVKNAENIQQGRFAGTG